MYEWILYGSGGFVLLVLVLRLLTASTKPFKSRLIATALWAGLCLTVLWLALNVNLGFALMMLVMAIPLWRGWIDQLSIARDVFSPKPSGKVVVLTSTFVELRLNHDTGVITGKVLEGPMTGWFLHEMDKHDLQTLRATCQKADGYSLTLLDQWLDKHGPTFWRRDFNLQEELPPPEKKPSGKMTRAQALEVLGLSEGADAQTVRDAHKRLMLRNHPDQGGSNFLAAQINLAKEELLQQ